MTWLAVALGGGIGAVLRYGAGLALVRVSTGFPWGTLLVNVLGSLLLGVFARWLSAPSFDPTWRIALTVGVCGGFTTFSTFSAEVIALLQEGRVARAALYVAASLLLGLAAMLLGLALGDRLLTGALRS
ncbi:MAG TPA: fluoride efflux transporter CrcB [Gemmatimonadaceae bacterium]|nr:fluoride efflux transporter CrcB [Gemmatimonadaceae bacterium]